MKISHAYDRLACYDAEHILKHVGPGRMEWCGKIIRMNSQRYKLFQQSTVCVSCGIVGTIMYLEKAKGCDDSHWHFNLYAIDDKGQEILMTKDHIIPKSKGGPNCLSNYQTMCSVCNLKKGNNLNYP